MSLNEGMNETFNERYIYPTPSTNGRYATYWNAFLLFIVFEVTLGSTHELSSEKLDFLAEMQAFIFLGCYDVHPPPHPTPNPRESRVPTAGA